MDKKFCMLDCDELMECEGGVGLAAFLVATGLCVIGGAIFGDGIAEGMAERAEEKAK